MKSNTQIISVKGIPNNYILLIKDFIEFIKTHYLVFPHTNSKKKITFATRKLGIKNNITREEIYDYL